ncbi:MAG: [protein-PII] uridylyltransferase [Pseudomonadales bacterium]
MTAPSHPSAAARHGTGSENASRPTTDRAATRRFGNGPGALVDALRARIAEADAALAERYWRNEDIDALVSERCALFDEVVREIWRAKVPAAEQKDMAVYAVGGYGRGELFPHSDIDLLILARRPARQRARITEFLHCVIDLNVEVGHSVRSLRDCKREAQQDLTVATALFERRLLMGSNDLAARLDKLLASPRLWPPEAFFKAKRDEQEKRHRQYDNVEYGLEPNLKTSPGGLRDLQTAIWVAARKFDTSDPAELERLGMLAPLEREWLENGRRFLWWVRFGLHLLAGRKEDHLQFEYQRGLAQRLGFADTSARLGVERFMHYYYRHVMELREVNDILLQHFDETILRARERPKILPINERFQIRNNYIEATGERVFDQQPSALLEIFVIMANRRDISGVRAETIRSIRDHLHLIDDGFRHDPENTRLFIDLLKAPYTLVSQLTRMRRYGVLGRYLPEFGNVVGQMQHDLFHIYTVDAHTMMVIRNMRRLHYRSAEQNYPVAAHCVRNLPKIELLYIAGLYHDIGKGRGGDHSELGAHDVTAFCRRHGLNDADTELVTWLVRQHLLMSSTAQRKDIYDPDVVHEFAAEVKSEMRLNYLYALTVADITATNPTLWNSWRATLLRILYGETRRALRRGLESPLDRQSSIDACRESALERLLQRGLDGADVERLWQVPGEDFFLRHTPRQVALVTERMHQHDVDQGPMVMLLDLRGHVTAEGATEIVLFTRDQPNLFAASVAALNQLDLSVHDATIHTADNGLCLNTYVVLEQNGEPLTTDSARREQMLEKLRGWLRDPSKYPSVVKRRVSRRLRQLTRASEVTLRNRRGTRHSELTVIAADRPGLLASLGRLFHELGLSVLSARITTLGERVEDVFFIVDENGKAVRDKERIYELENTLRQHLDRQIARGM